MVEYPTTADIHEAHERIVASNPGTEAGVRSPEAVESALVYISEGYFGQKPETIHKKAAHLMRLLAAEHPYVDGNKRTALAATAGFYALNGFKLDSDDKVREILRGFATDAESVDMARVVEYLSSNATER